MPLCELHLRTKAVVVAEAQHYKTKSHPTTPKSHQSHGDRWFGNGKTNTALA